MNHVPILIARLALQMDRTQQYDMETIGMIAYPPYSTDQYSIDGESTTSEANNS